VPDEFVARYQGLTHKQLWDHLTAGDPDQVEDLAAGWKLLHDTAGHLAASLQQDLAKLAGGWHSLSADEYQHRVSLISSFSNDLADNFQDVHTGLSLMAGDLRSAQKHAEDAADVNGTHIPTDAFIGTIAVGPAGGLVGAWYGHQQDKAEKEKARQRMIHLVAGLAASYSMAQTTSVPHSAPTPPAKLPGDSTRHGLFTAPSGPSVAAQEGIDGTTAPRSATEASGEVLPVPGNESQSLATNQGLQSVASDAESGPISSGSTPVGASGSAAGPMNSPTGAHVLTGADSVGKAGALGTAGLAASVLGAGGARAGSVPRGPSVPETPPGSYTTGDARSMTTPLPTENEESDDRLTWLTEDDAVWDSAAGAPPVLGKRSAAE